jgi:hypothetical protein
MAVASMRLRAVSLVPPGGTALSFPSRSKEKKDPEPGVVCTVCSGSEPSQEARGANMSGPARGYHDTSVSETRATCTNA